MSRHHFAWKIFFLSIFAISFTAASWQPTNDLDDRKTMWKKVDDAIEKGLPKTAIEHLDPIIESALGDEDYAEAVKAICQKITLEGMIQGNRAEEKIFRLQAAMKDQPAEVQPVLEAVLAHWYWHYFQQNRHRFSQRTQTGSSPSDDLQTWALPQILAEIDKHFSAAFADSDRLKKTPINQWNDLLVKGTMDDRFRPTLYDFLAHEALGFYQAGEQAGSQRSDSFELMADGPIFSETDVFLQWDIDSSDDTSPIRKGITLYQDLINFHLADDDRSALVDLELGRYAFGNNHALGEDKTSRYKSALIRFAEKNRDLPIYSRVQAALSSVNSQQADLVEARVQAQLGMDAYPKSPGGAMCFNIIQQIEGKALTLGTERVWNSPAPQISVNYKNLTRVHCRLIPNDIAGKIERGSVDFNLNQALAKRMLSRSIKNWTIDLPETKDFQLRTESIDAPLDVPKGSYWLVISADAGFENLENQVDVTNIWVSDLAVIMRDAVPTKNAKSNRSGGFVLDAKSGDPIANATIQYWVHDRGNRNQRPKWVRQKSVATDNNGVFSLAGTNQQRAIILVSKDGDMLGTDPQYFYARRNNSSNREQTVFFTDRSIYRPGQTISFKGVSLSLNQLADRYKTIPGRAVSVILRDANNQEVEKRTFRTNDFGSFSGSFAAPRDRVTGRMSISVIDGPQGATSIRVEEYKRPKFEVAVDLPTKEVKLGEKITVEGKATAYTGAAIDGAKVKWRVVRQVRFPDWWFWRCWWMPPGNNNSKEIAHGSTTTDVLGGFKVEFTAAPDLSVAKESEPTFQYVIYADVTDTAGETRTDQQTVNAGYTAIKASLGAANEKAGSDPDGDEERGQKIASPVANPTWLVADKAIELKIHTQTLNNLPASAKGTLTVYGLKQPTEVHRARLGGRYPSYRFSSTPAVEKPKDMPIDWSNLNAWPLDEKIESESFETGSDGIATASIALPAGVYRALLETKDQYGTPVTAELTFQVLDPARDRLDVKIPELFTAPNWQVKVGQELTALWGSGYESARCFIEVSHKGRLLQQYWTDAKHTQVRIKQKVTEAMRGGFTVRTTFVRENRMYYHSQHVDVPWENKKLTVKWERFVSKLKPGAEEVWTAVVTGPDAKKATAEMVATLYDASLDAFAPHQFINALSGFRQDTSYLNNRFQNSLLSLHRLYGHWQPNSRPSAVTYRSFPLQLIREIYGVTASRSIRRRGFSRSGGIGAGGGEGQAVAMELGAEMDFADQSEESFKVSKLAKSGGLNNGAQGGSTAPAQKTQLDQVAARTNLNETAFFFPHLTSSKDGTVRISFTMPEALTRWKFMALAHDNDMRSGYLTGTTVTAKDLMVQPNPPRFLREGDELEFTVKVSNQSPTRQNGTVRLSFSDARTLKSVDEQLANQQLDKEFDIPSKESRTFSWRIKVPDSLGVLTYKAVGSTGRLSDGEEAFLPVLSRRVLVTESLPIPLRGKTDKVFEMERLIDSAASDSLENKSLTVQMVSNPSWYAVMALPYLMEFPHQCSEQIFNRYYANRLARHIAKSDPKIRRIFDLWKGTEALDSPLEKNQDLKSIMIQETPWLLDAKNESKARRDVGILFDDNRLKTEMDRALMQLTQQQMHDGQWPWFPGGPGSHYITLYITTGFARLRHLGTETNMDDAIKAVGSLDTWMRRRYDKIEHKDLYVLSSTDALYLYCRSFFQKDVPANPSIKEAIEFYLNAGSKRWLKISSRQSKAQLALALKRYGRIDTARAIMRSIKEHSVVDDEMGRYWRDSEFSIWWYQAPIETQAIMIEAFDEVMADAQAVEDCKVWLLKQKQTRDWKTTKATADAVYALLLRGSDLLASDELVTMEVAGKVIEPEKVEAGTGFYEKRFVGPEITPEHGTIRVIKKDAGVSWGSAHWQYLEDMSKVSLYDGTPLKVTKDLYRSEDTNKGPVLKKVEGPISVGDKLVVRITIRTDRDMEFVHLKDYRGSGTEPVDVISKYRYQDGLAYYQSTKDTATHFFIDYLPKGVYVFEYTLRPQHAGHYQTGFANLQSMYAPEFGGHSESIWLDVNPD